MSVLWLATEGSFACSFPLGAARSVASAQAGRLCPLIPALLGKVMCFCIASWRSFELKAPTGRTQGPAETHHLSEQGWDQRAEPA